MVKFGVYKKDSAAVLCEQNMIAIFKAKGSAVMTKTSCELGQVQWKGVFQRERTQSA